jgi:hypothetical protein
MHKPVIPKTMSPISALLERAADQAKEEQGLVRAAEKAPWDRHQAEGFLALLRQRCQPLEHRRRVQVAAELGISPAAQVPPAMHDDAGKVLREAARRLIGFEHLRTEGEARGCQSTDPEATVEALWEKAHDYRLTETDRKRRDKLVERTLRAPARRRREQRDGHALVVLIAHLIWQITGKWPTSNRNLNLDGSARSDEEIVTGPWVDLIQAACAVYLPNWHAGHQTIGRLLSKFREGGGPEAWWVSMQTHATPSCLVGLLCGASREDLREATQEGRAGEVLSVLLPPQPGEGSWGWPVDKKDREAV